MNDETLLIRIVARTAETRNIFSEIASTMEGISLSEGEEARPGLVVCEAPDSLEPAGEGDGLDGTLAKIHTLIEGMSGLEVFLVVRDPAPRMLLEAMRAGVKEVLPAPLDPDEIRAALARARERRARGERVCREPAGHHGAIIDVIGAKGGVGTTTLAVNLAAALAARPGGGSVLIMDMNLAGGEIPLFLDLAPKYHWGEAFRDISRLDESFLMSLVAKRPDGIHVLAAPSSLDDLRLATPEAMARLLGLLRSLFAVVIIDGGQYLDEVSLAAVDAADTLLLVMVQNLPCVASTKRFLQHVRQNSWQVNEPQAATTQADVAAGSMRQGDMLGDRKLRVVVNRHLSGNDLDTDDLEQALGRKTFWNIPNDYQATLTAMNHGRTLLECAPKSVVTASLKGLAEELVPSTPSGNGRKAKGKGLFGLNLFGGRL